MAKKRFSKEEVKLIFERGKEIASRIAKKKGTSRTAQMQPGILQAIQELFPDRKRRTHERKGSKWSANEQECISVSIPWFVHHFEEGRFSKLPRKDILLRSIAASINTCAPKKKRKKLGESKMVMEKVVPLFRNPLKLSVKNRKKGIGITFFGGNRPLGQRLIVIGAGAGIGAVVHQAMDSAFSGFTKKGLRKPIMMAVGGGLSVLGFAQASNIVGGVGIGIIASAAIFSREGKSVVSAIIDPIGDVVSDSLEAVGGFVDRNVIKPTAKALNKIENKFNDFVQSTAGLIEDVPDEEEFTTIMAQLLFKNSDLEQEAINENLRNFKFSKAGTSLARIKQFFFDLGIITGRTRPRRKSQTFPAGGVRISNGSIELNPQYQNIIDAAGAEEGGEKFVKGPMRKLAKNAVTLLIKVKAATIQNWLDERTVSPSSREGFMRTKQDFINDASVFQEIVDFIDIGFTPAGFGSPVEAFEAQFGGFGF